MKIWKCLFAKHELWKWENICNICYEKIKMFVCNTQIMKLNYLFAKHELKNVYNTLWKHLFAIQESWK